MTRRYEVDEVGLFWDSRLGKRIAFIVIVNHVKSMVNDVKSIHGTVSSSFSYVCLPNGTRIRMRISHHLQCYPHCPSSLKGTRTVIAAALPILVFHGRHSGLGNMCLSGFQSRWIPWTMARMGRKKHCGNLKVDGRSVDHHNFPVVRRELRS